jgi:hypothetical protein
MANLNPTAKLTRFKDYSDQDRKDLAYGDQKKACQALVKKAKGQTGYKDTSISKDWTPEQD